MIDTKKNDKLFNTEKTYFQKQINEVLKDRTGIDTIKNIIKLIMLKDSNKSHNAMVLIDVYNYFGLDAFVDLIDIMNGKEVKFPDIEEFKETIKIAISYYYKYIKHQSWENIKELFNDDSSNSYIKYGINCSKLNRFITELSEQQLFKENKDD